MEKNEMEFSEMKLQLKALQERLDKQVDINDKQMRNAIGEKMNGLQRHDQRLLWLCAVIAIWLPLMVYYTQHCSLGFSIFTFVFLVANAIWQYFLKFNGRDRLRDNLVETAEYLVQYKKNLRTAQMIGIPCALVWVGLYLRELSVTGFVQDPETMKSVVFGCTFGAILGFLIGYRRFYLPSVHAADKIIAQINELKKI